MRFELYIFSGCLWYSSSFLKKQTLIIIAANFVGFHSSKVNYFLHDCIMLTINA